MKKRVVITGMEITSSIGTGVNKFWEAAKQGQCGIKRIQSYDPSVYPTQIAGEITDFSLEHLPELNKNKRYPRAAQFALYCTHNAIEQSGLTAHELSKAGTFMGTGMGGYPESETSYQFFFADNWRKMQPLTVIRGMANSIANFIAIAFGLGGPNSTISNACISSADAIGTAYHQIAHGNISTAICGGTEAPIWESMMSAWCKLKVLSTNNEQPTKACRPFDLNRAGMVMAEGAGVLILEELNQAKARGATIFAEIIGFGASCDAFHITVPSSEGQQRAIQGALDDAKLSPRDIQYLKAHGTGTPLNDRVETQTIKAKFGERAYELPITAQKSMIGHAIGASGVMEVISTSLSLQHDLLLPTINLETADPDCDLDYVPNEARKKAIDIVLSNHFAFGGANVALILRRYIR
ncbi:MULTISPECIES: beta-ketoacyl-[acyl-carrier-protein] synthase family protein [Legionella]|uniref:Nodulation protein E n=1 Tax=Legionella steelei TaxID=947033 RepID=A0A0W0ZJW4_9GAMM|nr:MULTISPECIES: beta-ketoacyl-[acyl-carrier-protein] synthase family protein [Legionella]KTD69354.1 3-oxoacyl-ACP synthase [Legionella steelei]MBN9226558.1 beta-ketoacyl-[acyl-carrier-protein] synthase family protein [Legionella steelei]OJW15520.1 MAG: 3-oxoacyl-ACP synthase [Legionella sp. 39-23]